MYPLSVYDEAFFVDNQREGLLHAQWFVPLLIDVFHPKSLIDVGCGTGHFVRWALDHGIGAWSLEGAEWAVEHSLTPLNVRHHDLRKPIEYDPRAHKFDLAISIEVAEHIEPEYAETFVETLCSLSDTIVLTAAVPGQGGEHHMNEQQPSYWWKLFLAKGFGMDRETCLRRQDLRRGIKQAKRNGEHVAGWFSNLQVYRRLG